MWDTIRTICFWFVMAEFALVMIAVIGWRIGEASEKRIRRRRDKGVAEMERLRNKVHGK